MTKKKSILAYALMGCGAALLLVVALFILLGVYVVKQAQQYVRPEFSEYEPYIEKYYQLVNDKDYKNSYASLAPAWKQVQTFEQYVEFETKSYESLGKMNSFEPTGICTRRGPFVSFDIMVHYEKEDAKVRFSFLNVNGKIDIAGVSNFSKKMLEDSICPKCGKQNKPSDKYCASCGQAIRKK